VRNNWPPGTDDEVRAMLARLIVRSEGNLVRVAWEAGIHSRHKLWLKLRKYRLWPLVNEARRIRAENLLRWRQKGVLLYAVQSDQDRADDSDESD